MAEQELAGAPDATVKVYGDGDKKVTPPFVFRIPGDPGIDLDDSPVIRVVQPDGGAVMDFIEATSAYQFRRGLQSLVGPDYRLIAEYVDRLDMDEVLNLSQDIARHFEIDTVLEPARNRRERRTARRSGRR